MIRSAFWKRALAMKRRLFSPWESCQPISTTICRSLAGILARSSPSPSSRQTASASKRSSGRGATGAP